MRDIYFLIKYKYEMGVFSLIDLISFVKKEIITKEEFRDITSFNYEVIKERS